MAPTEPRQRHDDASLDGWLDVARDAAAAASAVLRQARPANVRTKGNPRDLVTEWDLRGEEIIRERLAVRSPDIPVLGEEGGHGEGAEHARARWVVDPIDGTVNFAHGLPLWSVSIGLEIDGQPEVGVVTAPALGWTFWARRGGGAFVDQGGGVERLAVSAIDGVAGSLLATGFPYDHATNPRNNFAQWDHFQRVASACRRLGVASLDLCFVARGWFEGYWERGLKPWDLCAGVVIVAEAGGRVTDPRGGPFVLASGELMATNGAIHDEMLAQLAEADANAGLEKPSP